MLYNVTIEVTNGLVWLVMVDVSASAEAMLLLGDVQNMTVILAKSTTVSDIIFGKRHHIDSSNTWGMSVLFTSSFNS